MAAYAGLSLSAVRAARWRCDATPARVGPLWHATATIALVHVAMVWHFRYSWSFELAVRNGYAGFVIFHAALASILGASLARADIARRLVLIAFAIVTLGANGAVWRYDVVAIYRIPVMACAAIAWLLVLRLLALRARGG